MAMWFNEGRLAIAQVGDKIRITVDAPAFQNRQVMLVEIEPAEFAMALTAPGDQPCEFGTPIPLSPC